jgi:hypothetical protein
LIHKYTNEQINYESVTAALNEGEWSGSSCGGIISEEESWIIIRQETGGFQWRSACDDEEGKSLHLLESKPGYKPFSYLLY